MMNSTTKLVVITAIAGASIAISCTAANAADMPKSYASIESALKTIKIAPDVRDGYARSKFKHWSDLDKNGCNTRNDVIIAEALVKPKIEPGCKIVKDTGKWYSAYDALTVTNFSALDVDHMVPLAEAWDSGASTWTPEKREAYANDMGDSVSLIAVTAATNRSKSDQDPADWLPAKDVCSYLKNWVQVKVRWSLSMDDREVKAIRSSLSTSKCSTVKILVSIVK